MKIKIERSGGFAGTISSSELDSDELPPALEGTLKELLDRGKSPLSIGRRQHKGSADYLNYKITIQNGMKNSVIDCNEFDMESNVKSLINYIKEKSKKKI